MESKSKSGLTEGLDKLDGVLSEYLVKKAPALPANVKEFLVKFGPWISLILGIMILPVILAVFGVGVVLTPVAMMAGARFGAGYMLGVVVAGVQLVLQFVAIPGLMKRQMQGWKLTYYATLMGGVYSLVSFNVIGFVVGMGFGLYVLYQIKSYYK